LSAQVFRWSNDREKAAKNERNIRGETETMKYTQWMMAALLSVGTLATVNAQTSAPVKDDLFAGTEIFEKGATDVNEISMDPASLGMVTGKDSHKAHGMMLNVVRSYTYDKPGMYNPADVEPFRAKLNTNGWQCTVHSRNLKYGQSTDICEKQRTDGLRERAIITVAPKELTFIHQITHEGGGDSMMMLPGMSDLTTLAMLDHLDIPMHVAIPPIPPVHVNLPPIPPIPPININMRDLENSVREGMKNYQPMDSEEMKQIMAEAQKAVAEAQKSFSDAQRERQDATEPKQPE
jgi:hypothetical protein